ncbi:hypothetical protein [uncultured Aquabacterium sp.]|jgi:hypothetical protein|uniref:hypothetical protein n=1 Tax=uncultured Aquabacterium sp. TaxID=158753 RepID=UPI0026188319|nr:hypothetical protein [uncultured Aquabacterium sp.]
MTVLPFSVQVPLMPPALRHAATLWLLAAPLLLVAGEVQAQDKPVYRCPGNLYTDALSAKEAQSRGCKTLDGAPITVIQGPSSQRTQGGQGERAAGSGAGATAPKVTSDEQRARDADRRRILEAELRKEEEALAALQKEFNNGEPERRGDERNYQKYMDRVSAMRDAVTRKEADVAALRRELAALGAGR